VVVRISGTWIIYVFRTYRASYYGLITTLLGPADNGGPWIYDYTFPVSAYFNTIEFGVRIGNELVAMLCVSADILHFRFHCLLRI